MMPTLVETPPKGDGWSHEIKYDGYRTELIVDPDVIGAFTRNGHDWTDRYPAVVEAAGGLPTLSAIIDGEIVVQDESGVTDFQALRSAIAGEPHRLIFFAFDLLHVDGEDLRKRPLEERRATLAALIGPHDPAAAIQFSESVEGDGAQVFALATELGLEGIVSKRIGSRYASGTTRDWLKTKAMVEGEFVVVGVEPNPGGPPFALLARDTEAGLAYSGSAFVTLPKEERDRFWEGTENSEGGKAGGEGDQASQGGFPAAGAAGEGQAPSRRRNVEAREFERPSLLASRQAAPLQRAAALGYGVHPSQRKRAMPKANVRWRGTVRS